MPWNSATSVPGSIARCRSAQSAVAVRRGSTTTIFSAGLRSFAASMRRNRTGCAHAVFDPAMKRHRRGRCPRSSRRRVGAERLLVAGDRARHAQPRVGVDVVGADQPLRELVEDVVVLGQELARDVERDAVRPVLANAARRSDRRASSSASSHVAASNGAPRAGARSGCARAMRCAAGCAVRCSVRPLLQSSPKFAG